MELDLEDFTQRRLTRFDSSLLFCTDGFYTLLEKNRLKYFETFLNLSLKSIENDLHSFIEGTNSDDATYIFIK